MERNLTINLQFTMFQANSRSNHISKWCKTGIISKKTFIDRRQASYLSRWIKRMTSILVHPSHYFWNLSEKYRLTFTYILVNSFLIIWKLKGLTYLISFKTKPSYSMYAWKCMHTHKHLNVCLWMSNFPLGWKCKAHRTHTPLLNPKSTSQPKNCQAEK